MISHNLSEFIRESEERYRSLVEHSPDAIIIQSNGICCYANPAALALYGASRAGDLVGRPVLDFVHPEHRETVAARIRQTVESGYVAFRRESKIVRLDRQSVDVEVTGIRISHQGQPAAFVFLRDIGERKRMETLLRNSEERFRLAIEATHAMVYDLDVITNRVNALQGLQALLGYELTEADLSLAWWDRQIHIEDLPLCHDVFSNMLAHPCDQVLQYRMRHKQGHYLFVEAHVRPLCDATGRVVRMIGTVVDITEQKLAALALIKTKEELEQRVQARTTDLLGVVDTLQDEVVQRKLIECALRERSEQLRVLAGERAMAEQRERNRIAQILHDGLQQTLVGAKFRLATLDRGNDNGRAVAVVSDLIDDAVETSRSLTAELSPPILRQGGLIPALEWLTNFKSKKHGLTISLAADQDIDPAPEEVTDLLFQSTRELLSNVVKHAGVKAARVHIARGDRGICVTVEDDGIGFDPCQLGLKTNASEGLGLFTIRENLNLLGGGLEISSAPGLGTRITVSVPTRVPEKARPKVDLETKASVPAPRRRIKAPCTARKIRTLVVDDHMVMREGLAGLLVAASDIDVIGKAADGVAAIKLVRELRPDVVLMDISMPGMDGIEATKIIHHELPDVRVIGLSMFSEEERGAAMCQAGAVGYLTKSGPSDAVIDAIRASVRLKTAARNGS